MTRRGAINLSLIELARAFGKAGNLDSNFSMGTIIAAAVFALLTLLFAVLKKPIPAIVFTMLALGAFLLILKDFDLRGTFSGKQQLSARLRMLVCVHRNCSRNVWLNTDACREGKNEKTAHSRRQCRSKFRRCRR